jgi:hypothetical protein
MEFHGIVRLNEERQFSLKHQGVQLFDISVKSFDASRGHFGEKGLSFQAESSE